MRKIYLMLLAVCFAAMANGQITITVTGNTNTTPNLAVSYGSLAAALTDLNAVTAMTGPVVLTCNAGTSETAPVKGFVLGSATLNPVLSSTNTITINKTGGVVTINAGVGTSIGPSATPDGMLYLNGADYVTIDGLTFTDGNTTNTTETMEFGIALFKRAAGDGCNNNTIQNCIFNMQRLNNATGGGPLVEGSVSIGVYNSTAAAATTALTPTNGGTLATNGTNSANRFYSNTANSGNYGIALNGYAATVGVGPAPTATTFLGDMSNDIGGAALSSGNTILNYGGAVAATNPAAAIRANNQWGINISYNTINNNNGSGVNHVSTLRGIYAQAGTSASATVNNNVVSVQGGATTSTTTAIENSIGSTAAANTVTINNNTVSIAYPSATSGILNGILNGSSAATVNINNNSVTQISGVNITTTGTCVMIETGSPATVTTNNNTVSNLTRTAASGLWRGIKTTSPTNWTANQNTIENINWSTVTSTGSFDGFYSFSSAVNVTITNNIVRNISLPTTGTFRGIVEFGITGIKTFQNNQVYNVSTTAGGAGGATFTGITTFTGTVDISNNQVYSLNSAGTTGGTGGVISGIIVAGGTTNNVYKNKIYDLSTTSTTATSGAVNGILVSSGITNTIYNNLIGDLRATASAATDAIRGISSTLSSSSTSINVYYNTVYLNASSSGVNFGTTGIFHTTNATATSATLTMRNNIIYNTSTPAGTGFTVAYRRSSTTLTNFAAASNNNAFYASATVVSPYFIFHDGTAGYQIAGYKGLVTPRDAASFSEDPEFQSITGSSANFLKYKVTSAKQIESGAVNIATFTDDHIGTIRQGNGGYIGTGTAPDIGAWELEGITADLTGPSISYTALGSTLCLTDRTLSPVTITDASGVNITAGTRPRLYYRKGTNSNAFNDNTNATDGWKYVEATGVGGSPFSFTTDYSLLNGGVPVGGDVIHYFVVAQDNAGTPNVGINAGIFATTPASVALTGAAFPIGGTPSSYTINSGGLSGSVNVGPGETYLTLTAAGGLFATLNAGGLTGNLTANITGNITTEDGANALNAINYGCAGPYTLTIKPQTTAAVSGSLASSGLIRLNGADYVIIDGSNSGGTDQSLTITNTATTAPSVIQLISLGTGLGATNNTIKNCIISSGVATSSGFSISVGGSTQGTGGADNDNVTIQNNSVTNGVVGIYANGTASVSTGGNDNLVITGNTVDYNNITTGLASIGIDVGNSLNSSVSQNTVSQQTSASQSPTAISLETGFVSSTVTRNRITVSSTNNSGGYGGRGITVGTGTASSNLTIANNVIYGVNGTNWSGFSNSSAMGIAIGVIGNSSTLTTTTGGVNLYFNSVNMYGTYSSTTACLTTALYIGSGASALNIRDNVLVNSLDNTGSGTPSKAYSIYSAVANTAFTTINYNDYYVSGSEGVLGFIGSDRIDLTAIQTGFGSNANSIVANPLFNTNTNLIPLTGSPLVAAGENPNTSGITTDYLGASRGTPPTIGAYETATDGAGPTITYTALSNTCGTSARTLTASITDVSGVPTAGAGLPVLYWRINANPWNAATGVFVSGSNYDFTFGSGVVVTDVVQYYIVAQDNAGTPNVSAFPSAGAGGFTINPPAAGTPPTTPSSYTIQNTLPAGTYFVGTGQVPPHYTTLTAAVAAYNTSCLGGAIVFELLDASYNTRVTGSGEAFPIVINANGDASATNTLTIRPSTGVTAAINATNLVTVFKLNGADYVTIDGSNNGSTSRDMTITNTGTGSVLWIGTDATAGATNNTIKNLNMVGPGLFTGQGIISGSGTTFGAAAENGRPNSNNTIRNNTAKSVQNAVFVIGDPATLDQNWLITQNDFGSTVVAEKLSFRGISVQNAQNFSITQNIISGVNSSTGTSSTMSGILVGATLNGGTISRNQVRDIRQNNTTGWGSNGIFLTATSTASGINVNNNFVSDIFADGFADVTQADNGYGIMVNTGGGYSIYHNTVVLTTNQVKVTGIPAAINVAVGITTAASIDLRDNIIVNNQTVGVRYGIYCAAANTVFSNMDYNDYAVAAGGNLGFVGGSARATLADMVTGFGGNANSLSIAPTFVNPLTDFHLTAANCTLDGTGTPIGSVTVDYDNDTRNVTTPDMGADEFVALSGILAATPGGGQVCNNALVDVSGSTYKDPVCNAIARLLPNGGSPVTGMVNTCVTIDATVQTYGGYAYVQRHFDITPAVNQSTATARVTLYVYQTEFDAYNLSNGIDPDLPSGPGDVIGISNLRVIKYSGNGTAPGNYVPGVATQINPNDADIVWDAVNSWWAITIDVTGFSGFYIAGAFGALPVSLLNFSGYKDGSRNQLRWTTSSEQNNSGFEVQRSTDGINYSAIGFVNSQAIGGTSSIQLNYAFTDNNVTGSRQYYRLRQVDIAGNSKLSNIVLIKGDKPVIVMIDGLFPNPASTLVNVLIAAPNKEKLTMLVTDIIGRTVIQQSVNVEAGSNTIPVDITTLANGTYIVKLVCSSNCEMAVAKFVKQ